MPTLPSNFQEGLEDSMAENKWLWMTQIAVPTQSTQYHAGNIKDITYDGQVYTKSNLEVGARNITSDGSVPTLTMRVSALNATIYDMIQATNGGSDGVIKLIKVNGDYLTTAIPALEVDFQMLATSADEDWIYFTLGVASPIAQAVPLRDYSSQVCPYADPETFKGSRCQYAGGDPTCTGLLTDCDDKGNKNHWGGFTGLDKASMAV